MQPLIRLDICHKHNKFYCNFNVFCSFWSNLYCFKQRKDQKCRNLRDLWVNVHICLKLACVKIISAPYASNFLRTRVKTHSGEKENKCVQCDYASSEESNLKTHLKTHSAHVAPIFQQYNYFRQNLEENATFTFYFFSFASNFP